MSRLKGSVNIKEERAHPKEEKVIILDYLNFTWTRNEIKKCKEFWNSGTSIIDMAIMLKRECTEVFLLILHMVEMNLIKDREGKMWGWKIE